MANVTRSGGTITLPYDDFKVIFTAFLDTLADNPPSPFEAESVYEILLAHGDAYGCPRDFIESYRPESDDVESSAN